jgi:hypothetical protein
MTTPLDTLMVQALVAALQALGTDLLANNDATEEREAA